ncbi:MAG TPA: SDR family oxidoreductase [Anaerolineales bacterium]|nr:SDR family oxidoreductase [Anaerolineales bacterium]
MIEKSLKDKVVVITGATRGFGYAIAEAMLKAGAMVVISGRSQDSLSKAIALLEALGVVKGQICDVREEEQVYALARFAIQSFGRIDIWVNNAGYSSAAGLIVETPPQQAVDMFLANDMGTLYGSQAALHFMSQLKEGTLVNIYGNGSFLRPASPTGLYGATKAWITSFTRSLAQEIKGNGVKLIGFSPGMMLTDMLTNPVVIGEYGKAAMNRYSFVLRWLGGDPKDAAEKLVEIIANNKKDFMEYRMLRSSTMLLRLLRVKWQDLTKTGKTPEYTLQPADPYKPKID